MTKEKIGTMQTEKIAQGLDSAGEWVDLDKYWGTDYSQRFYCLCKELQEPKPITGWKAARVIERITFVNVLKIARKGD